MKKIRTTFSFAVFGVVASCAFFPPCASGQERGGGPVRAQVGHLFNLTKFVTFPAWKYPTPNAPMVVGFFSAQAVEDLFAEASMRDMAGRRILARHVTTEDDVRMCHILFIGQADGNRLRGLLSEARRHAVLSVSAMDNFPSAGGAVTLTDARGGMRLQINSEALRRCGVKIRSELLRLQSVDLVSDDGKLVDATKAKFFR